MQQKNDTVIHRGLIVDIPSQLFIQRLREYKDISPESYGGLIVYALSSMSIYN